jgi:hypothetical protein
MTLSFNEGILGFKISKKGGEYRIGDHLLFYPCIDIYQYSVSDTSERFLKHILYDLYEFTFIAIDKYQHNLELEDGDHEKNKDYYHYLIEVIPGFNVFHFNWLKKTDEYLKINTLYHGFGRLSTCGNAALDNPKIDPELMKRIRCKGILERLQINGLWRDSYELITPIIETIDEAFGYEDILKSIGYPDDMVKFRRIISKYQEDDTTIESTGQNNETNSLVYTIKMA